MSNSEGAMSNDGGSQRSESPPPLVDTDMEDLRHNHGQEEDPELNDLLSHPKVQNVVSRLERRLDKSDQKYKEMWNLAIDWKEELMGLKRQPSIEVEGSENLRPRKRGNLASKILVDGETAGKERCRSPGVDRYHPVHIDAKKRDDHHSRSATPHRERSLSPLSAMVDKMWPGERKTRKERDKKEVRGRKEKRDRPRDHSRDHRDNSRDRKRRNRDDKEDRHLSEGRDNSLSK